MTRRREILLVLVVFLVALAPRLLGPSPFITWDEPVWTYRSLKFLRALQTGDPAATRLTDHPGVVTMWVGAAGIVARTAVDPAVELDLGWVEALPDFDEDDPALLAALTPWWPWARGALAVVTAGLVAATFALLLRLTDRRTALVAAALLAFDPYLLAHGRVLQLDAVVAGALGASVVALVVHLCRGGTRHAVLAGVFAGVAALEKSPALFIVPFTAFVVVAHAVWYGRWRAVQTTAIPPAPVSAATVPSPSTPSASTPSAAAPPAPLGSRPVRTLLLWTAAAALTYAVVWPAMWAAPLDTVAAMWGYATRAAAGAREAVFFRGVVQPDPGVGLYVAALLFRLTPLALAGLAGAALARRRAGRPVRVLSVTLLAFAVGYTVFMGASGKKFERYILPVVPALDIVAAVGLVGLAGAGAVAVGRAAGSRGHSRSAWTARAVADAVLAGALAVQACAVLAVHPYYLGWYDPLPGGGAAAARMLPVGWGEGMDRVADYLNERPDAATLTVATPSVALLAPFFDGRTVRARDWETADYVVLYVDDVQIGAPDLVRRFHGARLPEHVVRVNGIDYAWVYRVRERSQPSGL